MSLAQAAWSVVGEACRDREFSVVTELFCHVRSSVGCAPRACHCVPERALASVVARSVAIMSSSDVTKLGRLPTQGHLSPRTQALSCARHCRDVQCLVAIGISCLRSTPVATKNPLSRQGTNILCHDKKFSVMIETRKWAVVHCDPLHFWLPFSFLSKIP